MLLLEQFRKKNYQDIIAALKTIIFKFLLTKNQCHYKKGDHAFVDENITEVLV